jgi:ubiquinone/menaquinone biosynthesis C-methylase UbiE
MHDEPRTWHYGVVARWWAEFNVSGPEIAYFQKFVEDEGEPALDVACGAGRLLIPYLQAGLDVDGCDVSPDMLALCRERATREGLSPNLYAQAMHELDLPRRYRTIVVCGGFGLGGTRDQDFAALRRFYERLEPGGLLLLDNENPYNDPRLWRYWLKEERTGLPEPLRDPGRRRTGSDGAEYELRSRVVELDPLAQSVAMEMQADMWRDGEHVASDEHALHMNLYFKNELVLMLERTGFVDVTVQGDYTDAAAGVGSEFLVFIAKKVDGQS